MCQCLANPHVLPLSAACLCLDRCVPAHVLAAAADPPPAAAVCRHVAGGSAKGRPGLREAGRVRVPGDGHGAGPAEPDAARQTAPAPALQSESQGPGPGSETRDPCRRFIVLLKGRLCLLSASGHTGAVQKRGNCQHGVCPASPGADPPTRLHRGE